MYIITIRLRVVIIIKSVFYILFIYKLTSMCLNQLYYFVISIPIFKIILEYFKKAKNNTIVSSSNNVIEKYFQR